MVNELHTDNGDYYIGHYPDYQNIWIIFKDEYPNAGWASSLGIRAWLASRHLDYLLCKESCYNIDRRDIEER